MELVLERIVNRYGTQLTWEHQSGSETIRGFFQPVISRSWQKQLREVSPLGETPTGLYVYIGTVSQAVAPGDTLTVGQYSYQVRRTEVIYDHKGPAYLWALCARKGGA